MNPRLAGLLALMYPRSWRKRYGAEFKELLESGRGGFRTVANVVWSGLQERICPTAGLAAAQIIGSGRLHSLCARAPWAIFSLAPVSLLAGCYIAACLILRIGWTIFLPGRDTPLGGGPVHGLANLYFQFGKYFYASAPILVGWVVAILAVRHRAKAIWPSTGFVLVAWMGAAARIRASRTEIPRDWGIFAWTLSFGHGLKTGTTVLFMHWSLSRLRCCRICFGKFTARERCPPDFHFHDWTNRPESLER